jgi:hypothetical protein
MSTGKGTQIENTDISDDDNSDDEDASNFIEQTLQRQKNMMADMNNGLAQKLS